MFIAQNFNNTKDGVSFEMSYFIQGEQQTLKVKVKDEITATSIYIRTAFSCLQGYIDELSDLLLDIEHHYFNPKSKPIFWSDTNWKLAYYDWRNMNEQLVGLYDRKEAYCDCVNYFTTRIEYLIPRHKDLKRDEIKYLISSIRMLPGKIQRAITKYNNKFDEINPTTSRVSNTV